MTVIISSIVGAAGTVLSAYVAVRVQKVQRAVNGHTAKLERRIAQLEAILRSTDAPTLAPGSYDSGDDPV